MSRKCERALYARWRKDAFVAKLCDLAATGLSICRRGSPRLVGGEVLRRERRGSCRKRLRRRSHFARYGALRDKTFFDREHWNSCVTIEHVEKTSLIALNHYWSWLAIVGKRSEQRRRCRVVVPQVMMHKLESPCDLSCFGMQRDDGVCPFIVARSQAAIVVRACASSWNKDEIASGVNCHDRPGVGGSCEPGFRRIFRSGYAIFR